MMDNDHTYDLLIIGAGPIGLECALYASACDLDYLILEKSRPAANMQQWGYVRMFSPWEMNISPLGQTALDFEADYGCPTGNEMVEQYYERLASLDSIAPRLISEMAVEHISRDGLLKNQFIGDSKRAAVPFLAFGRQADGSEHLFRARTVIDASGVYGTPNRLGRGGIPAVGERVNAAAIDYHLADLSNGTISSDDCSFLVVGAGHSACTMLVQLDQISRENRDIDVTWVTTSETNPAVAPIDNDPLPERARLIAQANALASGSNNSITHVAGHWIDQVADGKDTRLVVTLSDSSGSRRQIEVDRIFALVGYRPDRTLYEQLQVHECYASFGPMKLAAHLLSSGASTDCLAPVEGGDDLYNNPEPSFYVLGAKSYGRTSNFLIKKGHDQIRTVFRQITGRTDLDLYSEKV
ncbi:MAG: NAD(P)-binding domain-containing protein [Candidatus Zixiibacteriota bacterium]